MIIRHLERLTEKGWWTVGSQPAIDGVSSSDEVVGWGPKGGYVYQKCFVEFFVEKDEVNRIERKVREQGQGWVDYFAGDVNVSVCGLPFAGGIGAHMLLIGRVSDECTCRRPERGDMGRLRGTGNCADDDHRERIVLGMEGSFHLPRSEVIAVLIVMQEEAFSIWEEWASYYPPESQERKLLDGIRQKRWLVSVVHHDYKNPNALWTFLLEPTS